MIDHLALMIIITISTLVCWKPCSLYWDESQTSDINYLPVLTSILPSKSHTNLTEKANSSRGVGDSSIVAALKRAFSKIKHSWKGWEATVVESDHWPLTSLFEWVNYWYNHSKPVKTGISSQNLNLCGCDVWRTIFIGWSKITIHQGLYIQSKMLTGEVGKRLDNT